MRFMLLIYSEEGCWAEDEREKCFQESTQIANALHKEGKFLAASPLLPVSMATSVRVRDGKRSLTDGPFAETREQLGGFFMVEAKDIDEAVEIAARLPAARKGTVEVRPVHELEGLPGRQVGNSK
ncbi:YciI family protein [Schlesneria sp. T3-172]|uniref:YciI family protein n=1 Tax=Schlesneria TaxID=656899 RepID=UPI0037C8C65B